MTPDQKQQLAYGELVHNSTTINNKNVSRQTIMTTTAFGYTFRMCDIIISMISSNKMYRDWAKIC